MKALLGVVAVASLSIGLILAGSSFFSTATDGTLNCGYPQPWSFTYNSNTFQIYVQPTLPSSYGNCPQQYAPTASSLHLALAPVLYNVTVVGPSSCSTSSGCGIKNIEIQGWASSSSGSFDYICGGTAPSCKNTNTWQGMLDGTAQLSGNCGTAPLKMNGPSGGPSVILEAGVGGVCLSPVGVPEFPIQGLGFLLFAGIMFPALLLMRRLHPALRTPQ